MENRGYTLLELLGVIVILALLTTLVFPSVLNVIKKSSDQTDKLSMDLISNAADLYIENHADNFRKRNGSKFIIDMNELIEDGNLSSNVKISDIEDIKNKCVQVTYINNDYSYELKDKDTCEHFIALPEEYQQVEYIESTGTQYIEIDYIASSNTNSKGVFQIIDSNLTGSLFGSRVDASKNGYVLNFGGGNPYKFYNTFYNNSLTDKQIDTAKHSFEKDGLTLYIDDKFVSTHDEVSDFVTPTKLMIFGCNSNGTRTYAKVSLYSLQFYDNDILRVDLVPCYRKSDGERGLYDLVNDVFYTNSGTGTFEKGKDI